MDVDAKKMLVSLAAAVAGSRAVRAVSTTDAGDLLGLIGLDITTDKAQQTSVFRYER